MLSEFDLLRQGGAMAHQEHERGILDIKSENIDDKHVAYGAGDGVERKSTTRFVVCLLAAMLAFIP